MKNSSHSRFAATRFGERLEASLIGTAIPLVPAVFIAIKITRCFDIPGGGGVPSDPPVLAAAFALLLGSPLLFGTIWAGLTIALEVLYRAKALSRVSLLATAALTTVVSNHMAGPILNGLISAAANLPKPIQFFSILVVSPLQFSIGAVPAVVASGFASIGALTTWLALCACTAPTSDPPAGPSVGAKIVRASFCFPIVLAFLAPRPYGSQLGSYALYGGAIATVCSFTLLGMLSQRYPTQQRLRDLRVIGRCAVTYAVWLILLGVAIDESTRS